MNNEQPGSTTGQENLGSIAIAVDLLDAERLERLKEFQNSQPLKEEVLNLEITRMREKYGPAHPGVRKAESRMLFNRQMIVGLDKEIEKASVKTEPFDGKSWRIHGKVYDHEKKPVQGLTVYFSDQKKSWVRATGMACTNEAGYYSLTLDEKMVGTYGKQTLFLSVADKEKKVIYMAPEPVTISRGQIVNKDIHLNNQDCTTPPAGGGCKLFG